MDSEKDPVFEKQIYIEVIMFRTFYFVFIIFLSMVSYAKSKTIRKVQEINFAEMNLKGTLRNPEGAYLVQKRGIKFLPLHEVKKDMDAKIRESMQYVH
jgi:hypothetical protein